ncbi:hypothetical protein GCM10017557_34220 [Streptomyces aurantiacus]|uniref:Uncharacterized protein n=1 Tax=Streptomyces aurantiacus TaxID=47760 RepID=A0A7G1NYQ0_9ACTN|nr:hypothetical protein GCM10017557_34220 [Streptomyces aurantiacus]
MPETPQRLLGDWETETMQFLGWSRATEPKVPFAPQARPSRVPRGYGGNAGMAPDISMLAGTPLWRTSLHS